jgi:MFS family permease
MGMYFSFLSLLMAVVQGPILSFVAKRFSDITLAIVGTAILGLNFILLTQNVEILMYLAAVLFAVGNGLMWPSFLSIVAKIAGKQQGAVQGLTASASALASIIGLIAGGFLYGVLKFNTFYVAAAFILTVFILLLRLPSMLRVRK